MKRGTATGVSPQLQLVIALGGLLLLAGADCRTGVGGPPPCVDDAECVAICEAACASDPLITASCDEFLRACACECDVPVADAGVDAEP